MEVVDIAKHSDIAKDRQIVATRAVFRTLPAPLRRLIGDLSQKERSLLGLDLFTPLRSFRPKGKSASRAKVPQAAD
jgi:circadian clock protein KaiB